MNTKQTAELTGIPAEMLHRLRTRNSTTTLHSGPPFSRRIDKNGVYHYTYNKTQILSWMKKRNLLITAKEAADLLGITREEVLAVAGVKRFDIRCGFLVINPGKNLFIMVLKKTKKASK